MWQVYIYSFYFSHLNQCHIIYSAARQIEPACALSYSGYYLLGPENFAFNFIVRQVKYDKGFISSGDWF
jgi:hypothetical protein